MCLSTEWGILHHVDEAWLELKLEVGSSECWSSANVLGAWSREFTESYQPWLLKLLLSFLLVWSILIVGIY